MRSGWQNTAGVGGAAAVPQEMAQASRPETVDTRNYLNSRCVGQGLELLGGNKRKALKKSWGRENFPLIIMNLIFASRYTYLNHTDLPQRNASARGIYLIFLPYQAQCALGKGLIKLRRKRISRAAGRLHKNALCFSVRSSIELAEGYIKHFLPSSWVSPAGSSLPLVRAREGGKRGSEEVRNSCEQS